MPLEKTRGVGSGSSFLGVLLLVWIRWVATRGGNQAAASLPDRTWAHLDLARVSSELLVDELVLSDTTYPPLSVLNVPVIGLASVTAGTI
jgi:hypothetical protein